MMATTPGSASSLRGPNASTSTSTTHTQGKSLPPNCSEPSSLFVDELNDDESSPHPMVEAKSPALPGKLPSAGDISSTRGSQNAAADPPSASTSQHTNDKKRRAKSYESEGEASNESSTLTPAHHHNYGGSSAGSGTMQEESIRNSAHSDAALLQEDSSPMKRSRNGSKRGQK